MPTYDYVCKQCGHAWELFQSITAAAVRKCPHCGKLKAQRVIGPGAGIIFKGSGFYQTDYRSKSYKDSADAAKKAEGKSDGGSESGSSGSKSSADSKPSSTDAKSTAKSDS